jgi:HlyD family secretion protein
MNKSIIIILLAALSILEGCGDSKPSKEVLKRQQDSIAKSSNDVVGLAEIQPEKKIISLFARTSGTVSEVFHDLGDTVKKGDILAILDSKVEQAQLLQAQSKLGTQSAVINNNEATSSSLKVKSQNATENFERNAALYQSGGVTKQDLDNSRFTSESSKRDAEAAQAGVGQAVGRVKELKSDVNYAGAILEQKKIRAPYDGTILSFDVKVGNSITANHSLGDFAPAGHLIAVTEVDELYAQKVQVGMTAYIRPQGKSDTVAVGKVFLLSPYLNRKSLFSDAATNMEDRRVREVRILLNDGGKVLIGSRVDCVIKIK